MTLHGYWRCFAAYRERIALSWKGVAVTHDAIDLRIGAHQAQVNTE
jgi:hypothetical protein